MAAPDEIAFRDWTRGVVGELARVAAEATGAAFTVELSEVREFDDVDLRAELPVSGAAFLATPAGAERRCGGVMIVPDALLAALPEPTVEGDDDGPADAPSRLGRAASDVLRASLSGPSDAAVPWSDETLVRLEDSVWIGGGDPIASGRLLVADLAVATGGGEPVPARLLMSLDAAATLLGALTRTDGPVCLAFDPALRARLIELTPGALIVGDELALLERLGAGAAEVVIEVPRGRESLLGVVRGWCDLHPDRAIAVVVLLEEPSTWNVLQCGRLGFFAVAPRTIDADVLADRRRRAHDLLDHPALQLA